MRRQLAYDAGAGPWCQSSVNSKIAMEASPIRDDMPEALEKRGFEVDKRDPHSFYRGCVQMVLRECKEFIASLILSVKARPVGPRGDLFVPRVSAMCTGVP